MKKVSFNTKDDDLQSVAFSMDEVCEMVPDSDMRFTLVILHDGTKHFVQGTQQQVEQRLSDE